jgi:hypothetical protein
VFRDNRRAIAIILILYLLCGTADFTCQVEMEQAAAPSVRVVYNEAEQNGGEA